MNHRGHESPMDFQWENTSGRMDPNSPFRVTGIENTNPSPPNTPLRKNNNNQKPIFNTPVNNQDVSTSIPPAQPSSSIFSTPFNKLPSAHPFRTPAFVTPRQNLTSPSKDSDVFSTPGDGFDTESEAATPDNKIAQLLRSTGKKHGGISSLSLTSNRLSGRGELRRGRYYDSAISKPRRRGGRHQKDKSSLQWDDDESDDDEADYPSRREKESNTTASSGSAAREWVATHMEIPVIVSSYLNLMLRISLVAIAIYFLFACVQTIRHDLENQVHEATSSLIDEMTNCRKLYITNRCAPDLRVPAMERECDQWEQCMNQDPNRVARAKASVKAIAQILNSFASELNLKTYGLMAFLIFGTLFLMNLTGQRSSNPTPSAPPLHSYPPATPQPQPQPHWTPHDNHLWTSHRPSQDSSYHPLLQHQPDHHQLWTTPISKKMGSKPQARNEASLEWK